jgi:hypothetical protein
MLDSGARLRAPLIRDGARPGGADRRRDRLGDSTRPSGFSLIHPGRPHEAPASLIQAAITAVFVGAAFGRDQLGGRARRSTPRKELAAQVAGRPRGAGGRRPTRRDRVLAVATASLGPAAAAGPGQRRDPGGRRGVDGGAPGGLAGGVPASPPPPPRRRWPRDGCWRRPFVPPFFFPLQRGDLAGRVFAPGVGGGERILAGAAGAAGGIAAGYHPP